MALTRRTRLDDLRDPIAAAAAGHLGVDEVTVTRLDVPASAGFSNETVFADLAWTAAGQQHARQVVVRLQPDGPGLFPGYDLGVQWAIARALHADGRVPVPVPLWSDDDVATLGSPYYVTERVEGVAALDDPPYTAQGWFVDLPPDRRTAVHDRGLQAMAAVHAVPVASVPGVARTGVGDPFERELAYYEQFFAWAADGREHPTIAGALKWMRRERPTTPEPTVLAWGDARLGNLLVRDDLTISAVLDWEMATTGSPLLDLGWWLFMERHHTDGYGIPRPDGLPPRERTIERYAELTGHAVEHIDFYEAFAAMRGAIIMMRLASMMVDAGILSHDADVLVNNPGSRILAELTGQAPPAGAGMTGHVSRG